MATTAPIVTGTDFITVGTRDIATAERFWGEVLGLPVRKRWGNMPGAEFQAGNLTLAIMEPTAFGSEVQPHSLPIAFQVDDVAAELARLKAHDVLLIDETPRRGLFGLQVAFVHPEATGGVLAEFVAHGR